LISLKNKKSRIALLICLGLFIVVLGGLTILENSCGIKHMVLMHDISTYENSLDPEFCEELITRIDSFNSQCNPQMETLDCG